VAGQLFSDTKPQHELLQVYVDDNTGRSPRRGPAFSRMDDGPRHPGAFGRRVNACTCGSRCACCSSRRLCRSSAARPAASDLLMLLGFSISLAFSTTQDRSLVPLVYPFLIYLLVRMLLLANGRGLPRAPFACSPGAVAGCRDRVPDGVPDRSQRAQLNVIDVGYAGVIGADKLIHGVALYATAPRQLVRRHIRDGQLPDVRPVPLIFGWSGTWDSLPAAHAAAIFFDLLTMAGCTCSAAG